MVFWNNDVPEVLLFGGKQQNKDTEYRHAEVRLHVKITCFKTYYPLSSFPNCLDSVNYFFGNCGTKSCHNLQKLLTSLLQKKIKIFNRGVFRHFQ